MDTLIRMTFVDRHFDLTLQTLSLSVKMRKEKPAVLLTSPSNESHYRPLDGAECWVKAIHYIPANV